MCYNNTFLSLSLTHIYIYIERCIWYIYIYIYTPMYMTFYIHKYLFISTYINICAHICISIHTYVHTKLFFHNISHLWTNKKKVFHRTFRTTSNDLGSFQLHWGLVSQVRLGRPSLLPVPQHVHPAEGATVWNTPSWGGGGHGPNFFRWENGKKKQPHFGVEKATRFQQYCTSFFMEWCCNLRGFSFWLWNRGPGF